MVGRTDSASELALVAGAVSELARRTRFPVAFGGLERDDSVRVTSIVGARTRSLEGLVVHAARGLGGQALVEKRPRLALDYRSSRSITHDYDRAVLGEGITTLLAVPIVVGARARGVVYCGSWSPSPVGEGVARPAFAVAEALSTELRVRDEVQRRLASMPPAAEASALAPAAREELRESYAELRSIRAAVEDVALRDRLAGLERRLAALTRDGGISSPECRCAPHVPRDGCARVRRARRDQRRDRRHARPQRGHGEVVPAVGDGEAERLDAARSRRPRAARRHPALNA